MARSQKGPVNRRSFLTGAAAGAAAFVAKPALPAVGTAQEQARPAAAPARAEVTAEARPGSDFMVDVFKSLGFDYLFAMPGGSFGDLHESIINYGGNDKPEFITCMHEESSVAMNNGYA